MTCEHIEKMIWLYDELPGSERSLVDRHLNTCVSCRQIFDQSVILRLKAEEWRINVPVPENSAQLTNRIMTAIYSHSKSTSKRYWLDAINFAWLRYSLAFISIAMFAVLLSQPDVPHESAIISKESASNDVVLTSKIFLKRELKNQLEPRRVFSVKDYIISRKQTSSIQTKTSHENVQ